MAYVSVEELREECVSETDASDDRLSMLIEVASRQFDAWTGRFFEPRSMTLRVSGRGTKQLILEQPIISIDSVTVDGDLYDTSAYVVFNRHIDGMLSPDDRLTPRIELVQIAQIGLRQDIFRPPLVWPKGAQNVVIVGKFGYTDPDGTATGRTPLMVKRAIMLLVVKMLPSVGDTDARSEAFFASHVIEERTRDQAYKIDRGTGDPRSSGRFTGDGDIDQIISLYRRGAAVGTV